MSRRKRKSGKKVEQSTNQINLIAAIANLIAALILLYEKITS